MKEQELILTEEEKEIIIAFRSASEELRNSIKGALGINFHNPGAYEEVNDYGI